MTWNSLFIAKLAKNQDAQDKLRKEIEDLTKSQGEITFESLNEMVYLDQVFTGEFCYHCCLLTSSHG
jgi:Cytochrome P450